MLIVSKTPYHSPAEIAEALKVAKELVTEAGLEAELAAVGYGKAVDLLMQAHLELRPSAVAAPMMAVPQGRGH